MSIQNVVFDLGNVIIDLNIPRAESAFEELMGISFLEATNGDLDAFLDFETGKIEEAIFINYFIERAHKPIQALDVINAWNAMLVGIPEQRLQMVASLNSSYRTFFLSNTNETHLRWVGNYLTQNFPNYESLDSLVETAFYSHKMGCRKPDAEIYDMMLELGVMNPEETVFFDDNDENLEAARQKGINTMLVKPDDDLVVLVGKYLNL